MNEIKIFENSEFGKVRMIIKNGEIWFVGKDIAEILGYSETNAMTKRLEEEDFISDKLAGMNMKSILINESGLYAAILGSHLEMAKKFKRWVTSEVLPSIRKHGGYISGQEKLSDDELMARALEVAQRKIAEKNKLIEEQANKIQQDTPKVLFADSVSASSTSILVGELAKLLNQNGIKTGQKRLFSWLRENGYLMKNTSSFNLPTQKAMELGLFEIKESTVINPDNSVRINKTTKVTGKGQLYFVNKFLGGISNAS